MLVNVATQMLMEELFSTASMGKPVLVTGFEPVGTHKVKVSGEVAVDLAGHTVRGHQVKSLVLPVDYEGASTVSKLLENEVGPDWITNMELLKNLERKEFDKEFLEKFGETKLSGKRKLAG